MKPELIKILECPKCRSAFELEQNFLICKNGHKYFIEHDVPIFYQSDSVQETMEMDIHYGRKWYSACHNAVKKTIGSNLYLPASKKVKELCHNNQMLILDAGSGLAEKSENQINLDIELTDNVDILASIENMPLKQESVDVVRAIAVLEHIKDPKGALAEIRRVLKPDGFAYIVVPFMMHFHAYPDDYQRYTFEGLKKLCSDFDIVESGVSVGPGSALTALAADWFELFTFSKSRIINGIFRLIPLIFLFPIKYLDYLLVKNPRANECSLAHYVLCKKNHLWSHL